jgi:hypothetical protein
MMHRPRTNTMPTGIWLAFIALAVQVLVPLFIAGDFAQATTRTSPDNTIVICSALGTTRIPAPQERSHHRHGLLNGCPICTALAAGHVYAPPAPIPLPIPQTAPTVPFHAVSGLSGTSARSVGYDSRAPPAIG